jgi:hypothetical protein
VSQTAHLDPDIVAFSAIIPEEKLSPLWAASDGLRRHPLCELLGDTADPSALARATIQAMRLVSNNDPTWMDSLRKRLLDPTDFTNAAAALGEIRAYGTLALAGLNPKAIDRGANPDFQIELGGQTIIVEVHTKQIAANITIAGRPTLHAGGAHRRRISGSVPGGMRGRTPGRRPGKSPGRPERRDAARRRTRGEAAPWTR